jgi:hypothetical protein
MRGHRPPPQGATTMSRFAPLALRVTVLVAFVLVLAAPFRW